MRVTAIQAQTERKQQDRSIRHAEKRRRRARMMRVRGPIRPVPGVCATTDTAQGEKRLVNWRNQAILATDGRPLGENVGINRDCRQDGNTTTGFIDPRFHNCRPEGAEHSNLAVQEMEIDRRGFRIPRESRACAAKPKDKSGGPGPEKQG